MTLSGARTLLAATAHSLGNIPADIALIRVVPGAHREATIARLRQRFEHEDGPDGTPPESVKDFGRMSNLPGVLAGLLAALAAGTLAHMLTTSIRRRRRDLAILKTMGFARGQIRSAIGWQAITFTAVALAFSLPLGIVTGRWTWHLIARYGGFAPSASVPAFRIAIVALSSLVAALVLAALPARSAARTKPALVLRSE
jgi:ABC-type antimicrobial peptide transport system permease subunit